MIADQKPTDDKSQRKGLFINLSPRVHKALKFFADKSRPRASMGAHAVAAIEEYLRRHGRIS